MIIYLLFAFIFSTLCGLVFTPVILDFCKHKKLYDIPNERKVHKKAIPRLGGISFFPSMLVAFFMVLLFAPTIDHTLPVNVWTLSFILGLVLIYAVGIVDDLVGLNAFTKFVVQIVTALLLPLSGLYINNLYGLFGIHEIPYYIGCPLTVFAIVFIVNAINLIDGIDGLAAGLSLQALAGFLAYFIYYDAFSYTYNILIAGMMGALVAFLYFNLLGTTAKNNKIFMGDSGSLSLGLLLGFLAIKSAMNNENVWPARQEALIVPLTLLFVPTADVVRVTLHRLRNHKQLFQADKNHIHHKLMRAGLTQHQTLAFILLLALSFMVLNSVLYLMIPQTLIVIIDIVLYTFMHMAINKKTNIAA